MARERSRLRNAMQDDGALAPPDGDVEAGDGRPQPPEGGGDPGSKGLSRWGVPRAPEYRLVTIPGCQNTSSETSRGLMCQFS